MKKFFGAVFFSTLILAGLIVGAAYMMSQRVQIYQPPVQTIEAGLPILFLVDEEQVYDPMVPFKGELDPFEVDGSIAVWQTDAEPQLILSNEAFLTLSYQIISPYSLSVQNSGEINLNKGEAYGNGLKVSLPVKDLRQGMNGVLCITGETKDGTLHYYQRLRIGNEGQRLALSTAQMIHVAMLAGDNKALEWTKGSNSGGSLYEADQNAASDILLWKGMPERVKMNDPIPRITGYDVQKGIYEIALTFTIANRSNHEFAYWNFQEVYRIAVTDKEATLLDFSRTGNRRYESVYDEALEKWRIDEGANREVSEEIASPKGGYQAFVYNSALYVLDTMTNGLYLVHAFDQLDGDYILDEYKDYAIRTMSLTDSGELTYLVCGYMSAGEQQGNNGIMLRTYQVGGINSTKAFMETTHGRAYLEEAFSGKTYYDDTDKFLYFMMENQLYRCDWTGGAIDNLGTMDELARFLETGMVYWQDVPGKDNMGLTWMNLKQNYTALKRWSYEDRQLRVVAAGAEGLLVGIYQEKQTYEALDGDVFYPYEKLVYITGEGVTAAEIQAPENQYFSNVTVDAQTQTVSAGIYSLKISPATDPRKTKIAYVKTEDRTLGQLPSDRIDAGQKPADVRGMLTLYEAGSIWMVHAGPSRMKQMQFAKDEMLDPDHFFHDSRTRQASLFETYQSGRKTGTWGSLQETFVYIRNNPNAILYEWKPDGTRQLVYDGGAYAAKRTRLEVPLAAQKPELLRGCEVTALSMFASYYTKTTVDKMAVARRLIQDMTPYDVSAGWVRFANMHEGFAGSLTAKDEPGLGVYIEPIMEMAKDYISDGLINITGAGLDQMLFFVSKGSPVLVITPMTYSEVTAGQTEDWETPQGYMTVTYKEHAVVLIGYDDDYVYFNDPLTGQVGKRSKAQFAAGLDSMGRQGMTVWR